MRDKGVSNRAEGSWLGLASDDKGWLQLGVTREALYPGWRPWRGKNLPYGGEGSTSLLVPSPSMSQRSSSSWWHGEVPKSLRPRDCIGLVQAKVCIKLECGTQLEP